jgi:hypothetical protein
MNMHCRSGPCAVCSVIKHENEKKMSGECIHDLFLDIRSKRRKESFKRLFPSCRWLPDKEERSQGVD